MALIMDNQDEPTLEESSSMETEALEEGEIQEDGLNYFKSISQKNDKQGPSINNDLALGVTEILKSGLNTEAKDKFKELYLCPENCKRMEVVVCNPEILNTASSTIKKKTTLLVFFKQIS